MTDSNTSSTSIFGLTLMAAVVALAVVLISVISLVRNEPLILNDKQFGFGKMSSAQKDEEIASLRQSLKSAEISYDKLKVAHEALQQKIRQDTAQANVPWSPIQDIRLSLKSHPYPSPGDVQGKWKSPVSEVEMELLEVTSSDAVIAINLPEPNNRLRLSKGFSKIINKEKYQYQLIPIQFNSYSVDVRLERRYRP